jgi:ABC-type enterochelin transport system permease subunit
MVSYQAFTQTAVKTVASALDGPAPLIASWIDSSSAVTTFICGFAWMFVLSALAQALMFGRERRLSIQFLVSLALTAAGSAVLGLISILLGPNLADPAVLTGPFTAIFSNAAFAFFYLALPFIFMLVMDWRYMQKRR